MSEAFYTAEGGGRFSSAPLTRGPWDERSQHAGPPSALVARCLEHEHGREGAQVVRVTVEILRPVPIADLAVETEVLRPGRSVALLGASLRAAGQEVLRATAWLLRTEDIGFAAPPTPVPAPDPEDLGTAPFFAEAAEVGYHTAMDFRFAEGAFAEPGPASVWASMLVPLVAGEDPSPLVRVLVAADSGNGVSAVAQPGALLFVNTDLTVALHRLPSDRWVRMDARTVIEPNGIGQAVSTLHDRRGPLGIAAQSLFVAAR
jgi:hypothetical protein